MSSAGLGVSLLASIGHTATFLQMSHSENGRTPFHACVHVQTGSGIGLNRMQQEHAELVTTAILSVEEGTIQFRGSSSTSPPLPLSSVTRSQLLRDLVESCSTSDVTEVPVPVPWAVLQKWLSHIQRPGSCPNAPAHPHATQTGDAPGGALAAAPSNAAAIGSGDASAAQSSLASSGQPGGCHGPSTSPAPAATSHPVDGTRLNTSLSAEEACALMLVLVLIALLPGLVMPVAASL